MTHVCSAVANARLNFFQLVSCVYLQLSWASDRECRNRVAYAVVDTVIWQGLASVAIPGFTINRICYLSNLLLRYTVMRSVPVATRKWTVTAVGLSAIPFIIHPIDRAVDLLLNKTVRQWTSLSPLHGSATKATTEPHPSASDL